jgi:hypothetical protein
MEPSSPYRPRVSRETRLLLTTGAVALAVLWLLARIRFEDRAVTPNPVPAVLSQLGSRPTFDELAADLAQLQTSLEPLLVVVASSTSARESRSVLAIRWRDDLAIGMWPPAAPPPPDGNLRALDPASGLAVFRVQPDAAVAPLTSWLPRRPQQPRFFAAAEPTWERPTFRPVFVGSLVPAETALWPEPIWRVPGRVDLTPGSFVFTSGAELAGLAVSIEGEMLIVPAVMLIDAASRLLERGPGEPGTLGVETQPLTAPLVAVTGANAGVIVAWVDRDGPAGPVLRVGDVIEAVNGQTVVTAQQWDVWSARLRAGESVTLRVRRGEAVIDQTMTAAAILVDRPHGRSLGLTLRAMRAGGAEITSVDPGSAAERAGLVAGDVITLFGETSEPTPAQITRAFTVLPAGGRAIVAFTRADAHQMTVVQR